MRTIMMTIAAIFAFTLISSAHAGEIKDYRAGYLFYGKIMKGDHMKLDRIPDGAILYMHSPGGNAKTGFWMGEKIAAKKLKIRIIGGFFGGHHCLSACAIAAIHSDHIEGTIGFHTASLPKTSIYHGTEIGQKALARINGEIEALLIERGKGNIIPDFRKTGPTTFIDVRY